MPFCELDSGLSGYSEADLRTKSSVGLSKNTGVSVDGKFHLNTSSTSLSVDARNVKIKEL